VIRKTPLPPADVVLFCVLAGILGTFAGGYMFGEFNQVEHLPMVFRIMDADYLAQDFFVNATAGVNPRFYYVWLLAQAGHWIPLPALFVVLTCLANGLIVAVTWRVARQMSGRSDVAAVLACSMVIAVNAFNEGGAAQLPRSFLGPALLARPFAMLGLWLTIRGESVRPVLLFFAAIALHPLVGAETAGVALAAAAIAAIWEAVGVRRSWRSIAGGIFVRLAAMAAFLGAATYFLYRGELAGSVTAERFIHIVAETRAPFHYLPSRFGLGSHLAFAVFCVAAFVAWLRWRRETPAPAVAPAILAAAGVVVLACLGGYLFVEVLPTRVWASAQTFRMTYLIKWFGFLLFACTASVAMRAGAPFAAQLSSSLLVLGVGRFQPAIALLGNFGVGASRLLGAKGRVMATVLALGVVVTSAGLVTVPTRFRPEEPLVLALMLAMGACLLMVPSPMWRRLVPTLVVGVGVMLLVTFRAAPTTIRVARSIGIAAPRMSLVESAKIWTEAAHFVRDNTPADAILIVPPRLGGFRLIANRADVVDNKLFPFGDADMEEWYGRMLFTHTGSTEGELPSLMVLDENYALIDDERLIAVSRRYGATHALLWPNAPSRMPVLYQDEYFKVVRIEPPAEASGR